MADYTETGVDKIEHRSVIKFLTLEGESPINIFNRMQKVYEDSSPSYSTVKKWAAEYKRGRKSLEDDPRSGRPAEACTQQNIELIRDLITENPKSKIHQLEASTGLSHGTIFKILHDYLGMSKLCARWIPKILTTEQLNARVTTSLDLIVQFDRDPENFLDRRITGDETWIHHYDPESKQDSMEWLPKGSNPPLKPRTQPSAGKIMLTIFWDSDGALLTDYLPKGQSINGQYYAEILSRLREAVKSKRWGKLRKGVLLLHDNAPVHKSAVATAALRATGFTEIKHPPYSPDLAPSDYFLFPNMKKNFKGA